MSEPTITVQVDLSLDTVVGHSYRQVGEEDFVDSPITLGETIAERVAEKLADTYAKELRDSYRFDPLATAQEKADEAATKLIADALARFTQPVSSFGEPKGEPKTVAEIIDDKVTAWLEKPPSRDAYWGATNLNKILDDAVDHRWKQELQKTVVAAKKKISDGLAAEAEQVLSAALAEILRKGGAS